MNHSTHATRHKKADTIVTHIVLIAVCAVFFFPVLWLIMASFSRSGSIYDIGGFFPDSFSLAGYRRLFMDTSMYDYPRWLKNTLFVAVFSSLIGTVLVILTAYTISRFQFAGNDGSLSADGEFQSYKPSVESDLHLCGRSAYGISGPEGVFRYDIQFYL